MSPIVRNILGVVGGAVAGGVVNSGLILVGQGVIAPPEGVNPMDAESIAANIHLFEPRHFMVPFLAHAIGTLVGGWVAARIAASHRMILALVVGFLFLCGGISAAFMIPAPAWFIALDLIAAYMPMAWIGAKAAMRSGAGQGRAV